MKVRELPRHRSFLLLQAIGIPLAITRGVLSIAWTTVPTQFADAGAQDLAVIAAAYAVGVAAIILPAGWAADRWPVRRVLALGVGANVVPPIGLLAIVLAGSVTVPTFAAFSLCCAAAVACVSPANQRALAESVPEEVVATAAVVGTAVRLGVSILGALLAGIVGTGRPMAAVLTATTALTVVALGLVPLLRLRRVAKAGAARISWRRMVATVRAQPRLRLLTMGEIGLRLVLPIGVISPVLVAVEGSSALLPEVALAATLGGFAGSSVLAALPLNARPRACLVGLTVGTCAALLIAAALLRSGALGDMQNPNRWLTDLTVLTTSGLASALLAAVSAMLLQTAPDHIRGRLTAVVAVPRQLASAVAALSVGALAAGLTSPGTLALIAGLIALISWWPLRWYRPLD